MTIKQNIKTIIISLILSIVFFFIIFLIHNLAFESYTYKAQYSYLCNKLCKYDNMIDLYIDMSEQLNQELDEYKSLIDKLSYYEITTEEIRESVKIKLSGNTIILSVKNKDAQKGFLIYFVLQKLVNDYDLEEFNLTINKSPNYQNYLKYSIFTGVVLGLLFITSDIKLLNITKKEEEISDELSGGNVESLL